jgi:uncharacterized protein
MTPEEQKLVDALFDRLAKLESAPRDPDAERLIAAGLQRAPHAVYALAQTALVQDEALRRANARIQDLEAQLAGGGEEEQRPQGGSFLDSMRDALMGRQSPRPAGSVPTVRPQAAPPSNAPAPGYGPQGGGFGPQGGPGYGPQGAGPGFGPSPYGAGPGFGPGPAVGTGGSFLGTAASTAAGVIGGSLLLDSIRSMFGHHAGLGGQSLGGLTEDRTASAPWGSSKDDLARDLGADHIRDAEHDRGGAQSAADAQDDRDADQDDDQDAQDDQRDADAQDDREADAQDDQDADDADYADDDSGYDDDDGTYDA